MKIGKVKVEEIFLCNRCQYFQIRPTGEVMCTHKESFLQQISTKFSTNNTKYPIPDWCPLPDYSPAFKEITKDM